MLLLTNMYLTLVGLLINTVASVIILFPMINVKKNVDDDFILKMNTKTGDYVQKKHIKERKISIWAFSLYTIGFILQIIGTITSNL